MYFVGVTLVARQDWPGSCNCHRQEDHKISLCRVITACHVGKNRAESRVDGLSTGRIDIGQPIPPSSVFWNRVDEGVSVPGGVARACLEVDRLGIFKAAVL